MKRHCERSEQESRAKRGIASRSFDRKLKGLSPTSGQAALHREVVKHQFEEIYSPRWFGTIQWLPFITDYTSAVREARHFRNKFLCSLLNTKLTKIPDPPERPRIIFFHERKPALINPSNINNPYYKIVYHTHFHLEDCPSPYNSLIRLDWLIKNKVAKKFHYFSRLNSTDNKGFVLLEWKREHHADYNLKDYYRYQGKQDSDLVLDYENSDLCFQS